MLRVLNLLLIYETRLKAQKYTYKNHLALTHSCVIMKRLVSVFCNVSGNLQLQVSAVPNCLYQRTEETGKQRNAYVFS